MVKHFRACSLLVFLVGLVFPTGQFEAKITDQQRNFWSFQPIQDPPPPFVKDSGWPVAAVDRFILAKLEEQGMTPALPADRRTLIRRATFDLIGLPPTPEEMADFLADASPHAFEKVIDRLLASHHYGERWGRHWLDLAHYADTAGETADFPVPEAYRYRNYVIQAFNQDKPYDRFLREQIAGDLLTRNGPRDQYAELVTATGYLAIARRFGFDPQNYHHLTLEDTIDTIGRSILGLTLACARCHDHKFDPISRADYYALYGIFSSTRYPFPGSEEVKRPRDFVAMMPQPEVEAVMQPFQAQLATLDAELKKLEQDKAAVEKEARWRGEKAAKTAAPTPPPSEAEKKRLEECHRKVKDVTAALDEAKKRRDAYAARPPEIDRAYAVWDGSAQNARIHLRGDPLKLGEEVPRRFLQMLGGQALAPGAQGSGRLQLAEWLTDRANPLTARVMVNRIWQHHFGQGLVRTPSNFGKQGRRPTHPELLDYLASRFLAGGWSIKSMHKIIMLSRTYQQASTSDPSKFEKDPDNLWLARFERRRLDAESIRDALLAVSGTLDRSMGGRHPFPPESTWGFTQHNPFEAVYDTNRRSVYLMMQRIRRHPYLALFDGPDPNSTTAQRTVTTVPTQALFFMNHPLIHQQALQFAERLFRDRLDDRQRFDLAHQLAFGRPATPEGIQAGEAYLHHYLQELKSFSLVPAQHVLTAWASYVRVLFSSNEFVYVD